MQYTYHGVDQKEYKLVDPNITERDDNIEYERIHKINEHIRNNRNRFLYKNNVLPYCKEFAEVLSSIVGNRTIGNFCDAELMKLPTGALGKYKTGVASYYYYSADDELVKPEIFVPEFLEEQNIPMENYKRGSVPVDICLQAIFRKLATMKRPYSEYEEIKQQFIDMIMFDCMFGNDDRRVHNWMLYQDRNSKKVEMYPLFDHESFLGIGDRFNALGVQSGYADAEAISEEERKKNFKEKFIIYNRDLRMRIVRPEDWSKGYSNYEDLLSYMLKKYPKETMIAYGKIKTFTFGDLEKLLDEFPDLADEETEKMEEYCKHKYKTIAKSNFIVRSIVFDRILGDTSNEIIDSKQVS